MPVPVWYVPATQSTQKLALVTANPVPYLPAAHSWHTLAPTSEYLPATQAWQLETLVWPVPDEYNPALQALQFCVLSPRHPPYVPAEHGFGHAKMIMGTYVSPRKAYRAATSVLVSALL